MTAACFFLLCLTENVHIYKLNKKTSVVVILKNYIEERAVEVAKFIVSSNSTVRETAKKFGISKSTVHTDVTKKNL